MRGLKVRRDLLARAGFWLAPGMAAGFATGGYPWLGLATMAAMQAPIAAGTLLPGSPIFGPVVRRVDPRGWLLSIDDGPDPVDTPLLLEKLDRLGWKALFFFVGEKASRYPQLVAEVSAAGHGVGNHSWSHPERRWWAITSWQAEEEIRRTQDILGEILGQEPLWFRAPVGMANPWVHSLARAEGLRIMGWSARGLDGKAERPLEQVVSTLKDQVGRTGRQGAILLMHEGHHKRPYSAVDLLDRIASEVVNGKSP